MRAVSISEAETRLSQLIDALQSGEEVVIERAGRPVALLTAYDRDTSPRVLGGWKGKVGIADDFDDMPDAFLESFT